MRKATKASAGWGLESAGGERGREDGDRRRAYRRDAVVLGTPPVVTGFSQWRSLLRCCSRCVGGSRGPWLRLTCDCCK